MKNLFLMCLGGVMALLVYFFCLSFFVVQDKGNTGTDFQVSSPEVLYWVAPMDANFRRDKPGKSPMGMDLVPVYSKANDQAGVVRVSAAVINNLGVKTSEVQWIQPELNFISSGQVNYAKENLVHLHARTSGWVEKLYVSDLGERVKKGQALYGIYSLEFIDAQEDYLRALNAQNDGLIRAANNRLKALRIDNKVISKLKKTKKVTQVTTFYAPQNGYIEQLNINQGMYVKPENTLLTIANLNRLTVDVELDHQQAAWLSQYPGKIEWTLTSELMPTQRWQGKLDYIDPMLNETLRTLRVRLIVNNNEQLLKPNMWLNLTGNIIAADKTLLIPNQALIRGPHKSRVVMALGSGRFKSVAVTTGRFFNHQVEILNGLRAGDSVVTRAQFLIDSESAINSDLQRMESANDH